MNNLELVKSEKFGDVDCNFYRNDEGIDCMTAEQLGTALQYSTPRIAIGKMADRNKYLKEPEFSSVTKMVTEAGVRETRVFTEDGIMEVTMLAKTPVARQFRSWVRKVLKSIHHGDTILMKPTGIDLKLMDAQTRNINARAKELHEKNQLAKVTVKLMDSKGISVQQMEVLRVNAIKVITGTKETPFATEKFYAATDIANELRISKWTVGHIAKIEHLKNSEYGHWKKTTDEGHKSRRFFYNERGKQRIIKAYNG